MNQYEIIHLTKLASSEPFPFQWSDTFEAELRRLLGLGLIERVPAFRLSFSDGDRAAELLAHSCPIVEQPS